MNKEIINDQKNIIHRLQQECTEKTNAIIALGERLQAKEQECEELKKTITNLENIRDEFSTKLGQIKAEFDKKELIFAGIETSNRLLIEKNNKLKQTLIEIKEIAEPFCNACQEFEPEKMGRNCMYCNYGKTLQKISEVEK